MGDPLKSIDVFDMSRRDPYWPHKSFIVWNGDGENKNFPNSYKRNKMTKRLVAMIKKLSTLDKDFKDRFIDNVVYVGITSQYRKPSSSAYSSGSHHNRPHGACDFMCYPIYLNLYLYIMIKKYFPKQRIFIASFTSICHIDDKDNGLTGFEMISRKGKIVLPSKVSEKLRYRPKTGDRIKILSSSESQNIYKEWMLKYYEIGKMGLFNFSFADFIKTNLIKYTKKESDIKTNFGILKYGTILILGAMFFIKNKNGE